MRFRSRFAITLVATASLIFSFSPALSAAESTRGIGSGPVIQGLFLGKPVTGDSEHVTVFNAVLLGSNEAPGPGDEDGTGTAVVTIDSEAMTVSYAITVQNIATPTAAHIHEGAAGVPGDIVVDLMPSFSNGVATGTVTGVDAGLIAEILADPSDFYVNVHNADFPSGAVRGQLRVDDTSSNVIIFPVVARVAGAVGTNFKTDIRLVNNTGAVSDIVLEFYPGGGTANGGASESVSLTIQPGEQIVIDDVLTESFGLDEGLGALRVASSTPIVGIARIYNDQRDSDAGTFGQSAVGADFRVASRQLGVLAGLSDSPIGAGPFRTNIGWFNAGPSPATLTLRAHANDGSVIETVTVTLPPLSQLQQRVTALFSGLGTRENFYISYTTGSPSVFLYASVVDNVNGDAVFVPAQ